MTQSVHEPTFNLWSEAWIALERSDGPPIRAGIEQTLLDAHHFTAIYNLSPLVIVGIHRLLVAILQDCLNPQRSVELRELWQAGQFPAERIRDFGQNYADRFDLFSKEKPFMQSGGLPAAPIKDGNNKTVGYLAAETSPATAIDHYRHGYPEGEYFCPACAAGALLTIPPFTSIGGRGYKPSINGIPPLYVLPGGQNLFQSLVLSLLLPGENHWPPSASRRQDLPWWKHPPVVERGKEVIEVGYLHSLTFPARQVRLHPLKLDSLCTRCGQTSTWGVQTMVFEMGESRPKDAIPWADPFVAHRMPEEDKPGYPVAIRPNSGKALWREYAGLFLYPSEKGKKRIHRPAILNRIAEEYGNDVAVLRFRCIGARMDQAKVLEWVDSTFGVPASLMNDIGVTYLVRNATQFVEDCAAVMTGVFRSTVNPSRRRDRHKVLRDQMLDHFWTRLADPFRDLILELVKEENRLISIKNWADIVTHHAQNSFDETITGIGDDAFSLRRQEVGKRDCRVALSRKRAKYLELEGVSL
jgi:CRISPR system Cascade subunit CasA